jgi:hypothetical protein
VTASREGTLAFRGYHTWYKVVDERAAANGKLPLLVLHGGPGLPHDYLEDLARLGGRRPVVFYDQLGCGSSDHPDDPSLWVMDTFVRRSTRCGRPSGSTASICSATPGAAGSPWSTPRPTGRAGRPRPHEHVRQRLCVREGGQEAEGVPASGGAGGHRPTRGTGHDRRPRVPPSGDGLHLAMDVPPRSLPRAPGSIGIHHESGRLQDRPCRDRSGT